MLRDEKAETWGGVVGAATEEAWSQLESGIEETLNRVGDGLPVVAVGVLPPVIVLCTVAGTVSCHPRDDLRSSSAYQRAHRREGLGVMRTRHRLPSHTRNTSSLTCSGQGECGTFFSRRADSPSGVTRPCGRENRKSLMSTIR